MSTELEILKDNINTMTSTQFAEMTGRSKSSIHKTVEAMVDKGSFHVKSYHKSVWMEAYGLEV